MQLTIDPKDVLILMNSSDPMSLLLSESYRSAWSIPSQNVIISKLGKKESLDSQDQLTRVISDLSKRSEKYVILTFRMPTLYLQTSSITGALSDNGKQSFMIATMDLVKEPSRLRAVSIETGVAVEYGKSQEPAILDWWQKEVSPRSVLFIGDGLCSSQ